MEIKVLGPGCANCKNTLKRIEQVVVEKGIAANFEKVEDMQERLTRSKPGSVVEKIKMVRDVGQAPSYGLTSAATISKSMTRAIGIVISLAHY